MRPTYNKKLKKVQYNLRLAIKHWDTSRLNVLTAFNFAQSFSMVFAPKDPSFLMMPVPAQSSLKVVSSMTPEEQTTQFSVSFANSLSFDVNAYFAITDNVLYQALSARRILTEEESEVLSLVLRAVEIPIPARGLDDIKVEYQEEPEEHPYFKHSAFLLFYKILYISTGVFVLLGTFSMLSAKIGAHFMKLGQTLGILKVLYFIPVYFSGSLLSSLYALSELREPLELESDMFLEGHPAEGELYWGKIGYRGIRRNILQSYSAVPLAFIASSIVYLLLKASSSLFGCSGNKCIKKTLEFFRHLLYFLVEFSFLDIAFYSAYNLKKLSTDFETMEFASFGVAFFSFVGMTLCYGSLLSSSVQGRYSSNYEEQAVVHMIREKMLKKSVKLNILNPLSRIRLIVLVVIIVALQKSPMACLISLCIVQGVFLIFLSSMAFQKEEIFSSVFEFLVKFLFEFFLGIILGSCWLFTLLQKEFSSDYPESQEVLKNMLVYSMVGLIIITALYVLFRAIQLLLALLPKRKTRKQVEPRRIPQQIKEVRLQKEEAKKHIMMAKEEKVEAPLQRHISIKAPRVNTPLRRPVNSQVFRMKLQKKRKEEKKNTVKKYLTSFKESLSNSFNKKKTLEKEKDFVPVGFEEEKVEAVPEVKLEQKVEEPEKKVEEPKIWAEAPKYERTVSKVNQSNAFGRSYTTNPNRTLKRSTGSHSSFWRRAYSKVKFKLRGPWR